MNRERNSMRERVVVAMSGGVDSSVAAAMLVAEGCDVVGVTMHLAGDASRCCSLEDADDARRVAEKLGVRFFVANYTEQFNEEVVEAFADSYLAGRTPIPCVTCNSKFKFEYLMTRAELFGAERVATGHYARAETDPKTGRRRLLRARYLPKDQSYFLHQLSQEQLARVSFPLGSLSKEEVRKRARELGLATADKPESQEICFVPDGDYAAVVERIRPEAASLGGEIVDERGRILATHAGVHRFTVGQRKGLGVSVSSDPLYVTRIDAKERRVFVGPRENLGAAGAEIEEVSWIAEKPQEGSLHARVQIRHRDPGTLARIEPQADGRALVYFDEPVRALAPGQAAVFYDAERNEEVLGGGWIRGALG
jgi:tRNA-specific 2-thiouridylase